MVTSNNKICDSK